MTRTHVFGLWDRAGTTSSLSCYFVLRARLELARPQWSQDFLTTFAFTRTIFNITWSDVVVWTISLPYWNLARCQIIRFQLRYHLYSLYAIYQLLLIEFSEPWPKQIFLSARFLFVRVILLQGFLTWALFFYKSPACLPIPPPEQNSCFERIY